MRPTRRWSALIQGRIKARILGMIAAATLFGCMTAGKPPVAVAPPPSLTLAAARFEDLLGWSNGDSTSALEAFRRSCSEIQEKAADAPLGGVGRAGGGGRLGGGGPPS